MVSFYLSQQHLLPFPRSRKAQPACIEKPFQHCREKRSAAEAEIKEREKLSSLCVTFLREPGKAINKTSRFCLDLPCCSGEREVLQSSRWRGWNPNRSTDIRIAGFTPPVSCLVSKGFTFEPASFWALKGAVITPAVCLPPAKQVTYELKKKKREHLLLTSNRPAIMMNDGHSYRRGNILKTPSPSPKWGERGGRE